MASTKIQKTSYKNVLGELPELRHVCFRKSVIQICYVAQIIFVSYDA